MTYSSSSSSTSFGSGEHTWHLKDLGKSLPQTGISSKPKIEGDVGKHTLGQHAGELLLDLHTYMKQHHRCEKKPSILTMPGMIVDKTMVRYLNNHSTFRKQSLNQLVHF